jgi:hypothetical protein
VAALVAAVLVICTSLGATVYAGNRGNNGDRKHVPTRHRIDIEAFMTGLACVESGGRFEAENRVTHAYGKYQIMPRNWTYWAMYYMHNRWALPTPDNQEYIARQRITDLYELRKRWRLVAHWWLTGSADPNEKLWSRSSTHYVGAVMSFAKYAATPKLETLVPNRCSPLDWDSIKPDIRTSPWPHVRVTGKRVHVRVEPRADSRFTTIVKAGERFAALDFKKDRFGKKWVKLGFPDGSTGWVAAWLTNALERGLI